MDLEELAAQRAAHRAARRARNEQNFDAQLRGIKNGSASQQIPSISVPPSIDAQVTSAPAPEPVVATPTNSSEARQLPLQEVKAPEVVPTTAGQNRQDHVAPSVLEDTMQQEREATDAEIVPEIEQLEIEPSETEEEGPLNIVPRTENEFFIALPFNAGCRDVYYQIVRSTKHEREDVFNIVSEHESIETLGSAETDTINNVRSMISTLELLCSHPDLHSDDYSTQRADSYITQAKFAENRSTKCIFIAELVQEMRLQSKHIAIIVRPGRMLEILEAVLIYHEFVRQEVSEYEFQYQGALIVSLIPSDQAKGSQLTFADLVIAFDNTFAHQPSLKTLRSSAGPALSPLVHLVVFQSVEHLQLLFPATLPLLERIGKMVGCLSLIQNDVGKIESNPKKTAEEVASFVAESDNGAEWPCQDLPIVRVAQGFVDDMRSSASPVATHRMVPAPSASATPGPISAKRQLEDDDMNVDSPKRQRLTPTPEEVDCSLADIPNSMSLDAYVPSQNSGNLFNGVRGPVNEPSMQGTEEQFQAENLKLRQQLLEREEFEADLLRLNRNLQAQLLDLKASISSMQPKYVEALNERAESTHKEKQAASASLISQKNLEARQQELSTLKEQKDSLTTQLAEARDIMSKSTIPDISKLASLEEQVKNLKAENEKLERQKQNASNDANYLRDRYQAASNAAAESAATTMDLQNEIASLKVAASGERIRIHEIQRDQDKAALSRMVKQLRAEKAELQRELEKKATELANATNGRRSTRGTSTPMSPRVMSPGGGPYASSASRGNLSRILQQQQARSRGNSPSVAERAVVNGQAVFGDLLPPPNRYDGVRR